MVTDRDDACRVSASRKPSLQIRYVSSESKIVVLYTYMNTMKVVPYSLKIHNTGGFLDRILLINTTLKKFLSNCYHIFTITVPMTPQDKVHWVVASQPLLLGEW